MLHLRCLKGIKVQKAWYFLFLLLINDYRFIKKLFRP